MITQDRQGQMARRTVTNVTVKSFFPVATQLSLVISHYRNRAAERLRQIEKTNGCCNLPTALAAASSVKLT